MIRSTLKISSLQAELGPPPVAALGVVLDGAVSLEAAPLGEGTVLLLLLGEDLLDAEGFLGRHGGGKDLFWGERRRGGVSVCLGGWEWVEVEGEVKGQNDTQRSKATLIKLYTDPL